MTNPFDTTLLPLSEPAEIVAGLYAAWRRDLDIPTTGYTVKFNLAGDSITATYGDDGYWLFETVSAVTEGWTENDAVRWTLTVTRDSDSEVAEIESGYVRIFTSTSDRRTHAELMLVKIESVLSGRADSDVESYTIKGRSLTKMSIKELTDWRDYYRAEVSVSGGSTKGDRANPLKLGIRWVS